MLRRDDAPGERRAIRGESPTVRHPGKVFIWAPVAWALVGWALTGWRITRQAGDGSDCLYLRGGPVGC